MNIIFSNPVTRRCFRLFFEHSRIPPLLQRLFYVFTSIPAETSFSLKIFCWFSLIFYKRIDVLLVTRLSSVCYCRHHWSPLTNRLITYAIVGNTLDCPAEKNILVPQISADDFKNEYNKHRFGMQRLMLVPLNILRRPRFQCLK